MTASGFKKGIATALAMFTAALCSGATACSELIDGVRVSALAGATAASAAVIIALAALAVLLLVVLEAPEEV